MGDKRQRVMTMRNTNLKKGMKMALVTAVVVACLAPRETIPAQVFQDRQVIVTSFPNPFDSRSGVTTVRYTLNTEAEVSVKIYDLFGNVVKEYPAARHIPGTVNLTWDGTNDAGSKVAKGGYLFVVVVTAESQQLLAVRKIGVVH